jgi:hypothetical protein
LPPLVGLGSGYSLVGQDHGLLGAGRSHQVQHPWHALPAHVHAEPDLGHAHMGVSGHHAKVQRDRQRHAATDAKAFDGADGDLLHFLPCPRQPRSEFQVASQRAEVHGFAGATFRILQVKAGGERFGAAGQHYDRSRVVILKTSRGVRELAHRLRRHRVDAVAAVETHDRDAAFRSQALLDLHKISQRTASLPFGFPKP